jgi:fumarylacetoacetase
VAALARSWVPGADGSGFGIENLPYGVVRRHGAHGVGSAGGVAVRIGDHALDLATMGRSGCFEVPGLPAGVFEAPSLNPFLELGPRVWAATRARITELLGADSREIHQVRGLVQRALVSLEEVEQLLPVAVGDYVDFYSSIEHASNAGRIFRPGGEPLNANWRHLPVAYHGRCATVVVSGTPVRRPCGQRPPATAGGRPTFGPERRLDAELELGFVTGPGPPAGVPIAAADAGGIIFGFVLINDWSAREIQRWESQPLGPFASKSFATSIAPWVVPLEAVQHLRVEGVRQSPAPLDHLLVREPWALDIDLELAIVADGIETTLSRMNSRGLYWNAAQQLAHAASGGARVRAGDLFASGTISGAQPGTYGCLLELSWDGRDALALAAGGRRTYLEDGDEVVIRGEGRRHGGRISFGEVRGRVEPAEGTNGR